MRPFGGGCLALWGFLKSSAFAVVFGSKVAVGIYCAVWMLWVYGERRRSHRSMETRCFLEYVLDGGNSVFQWCLLGVFFPIGDSWGSSLAGHAHLSSSS